MNILIIEDNRHMRRMLCEIVGDALRPTQVLEAEDASSALVLCRDIAPELVLMDVGLPDANGIELTAAIKILHPRTAVVIVSSHRSHIYLDAARAAGAASYVFKDDIPDKLLPALAAALQDTHCSQ